MTDVRLSLIELLTFPRLHALDKIIAGECPHDARFTHGDPRCESCRHGAECEWLQSSDAFVDFATRPQDELVRALRFAVGYIESCNHRPRQRIATCVCVSCRWLQRAGQMLRELDGRSIRPGLQG